MKESSKYIEVNEICESFNIGKSKAYQIIRELNKELEDQGYKTIRGRVSRQYFNERFYGYGENEE